MTGTTSPTEPGANAPGSAGVRVLVVDDEASIADLVATALRYEGFETLTAGDGHAALAAVESFRPDLVVLDIMLPDLDGFEVHRRLADRGVHVPVLFLTARDATEDKVRGLTIGADDYVTKPFSLEELVARIRAVLRRAQGDDTGERAARVRGSRDGRGGARGLPGRARRRSHADRVRLAAVLPAEPAAGAVEGADPGPRLALRLRRRRLDRRDLHVVPAQEDRDRRPSPAAHRARRGLRAATAEGAERCRCGRGC